MKKLLILLITVLALFMCYPTEGLAQKQQSSLNTPSVSQSRNKNTKILEDVYISVKDIISGKVDKEYLKKKKFKKIFKSVTEYPHDDMKFTYEVWGYNIEYDDENCTYKSLGPGAFAYTLSDSPDPDDCFVMFDENLKNRYLSEIKAAGYKQDSEISHLYVLDDENVGDAFCYKKEHGYFIFSHGLCNSCE